jgi:hypothetical protein
MKGLECMIVEGITVIVWTLIGDWIVNSTTKSIENGKIYYPQFRKIAIIGGTFFISTLGSVATVLLLKYL